MQPNPEVTSPLPRLWRGILISLLALVVLVLVFAAGVLTGRILAVPGSGTAFRTPLVPGMSLGPESANEPPGVDLTVFWEAWNTLESRFYYDRPSTQERVYGAIRGMVESYGDPYTAWVDPDRAAILRENNTGSFEGIGAYILEAPEGGIVITGVIEGGPAEEAGLKAGDIVIAVDGEDITDQILEESQRQIRGPAGTDVTLTIVREGAEEPLDITITRAHIELPTAEWHMIENTNIGYISLAEFNSRASDLMEQGLQELMDDGAEAIILDLRNDPGGFLTEATEIGDMFLDDGVILIQRDVDGQETVHRSQNGDIAEDIPLVVLINGGSASASEIVAGAIQDRGRGTLIGETSFGKGSVQLLYDLSDGSQLRVTYANWYTPNDHSITEQGIAPDIVVEMPEEQPQEGNDPQLERAIEYLSTGQ